MQTAEERDLRDLFWCPFEMTDQPLLVWISSLKQMPISDVCQYFLQISDLLPQIYSLDDGTNLRENLDIFITEHIWTIYLNILVPFW